MAITDYNYSKSLEVVSVSGTPTIGRALCIKITSGDGTDPGRPAPQAPPGYYQDMEQPHRFHPKPKQSLSDTVQQGEKKRRDCPTCGDNKNNITG